MDPQEPNCSDSSLRYLRNLIESRHGSLEEISSLASENHIYRALEESLNASVYFYKTQLEKADFQNIQLCQSLQAIENLLTGKVKELVVSLLKKSEAEMISDTNIAQLKAQVENEIKLRLLMEDLNKKLIIKVKELQFEITDSHTNSSLEKQELVDNFIFQTSALNRQILDKDKEIKDLHILLEERNKKLEHFELKETTFLVPIAEERSITEMSESLAKHKKKYSLLKEKNKNVILSINGLLKDIEAKSPILIAQQDSYEQLVISYNEVARENDEFTIFKNTQSEIIERNSLALKRQSLYISEMTEKFAILTNELHKLSIENHKLSTGDTKLATSYEENEKRFIENSDLKMKISKLEEEHRTKSGLLILKDKEIIGLKKEIENLKKDLGELNIKCEILGQIKESSSISQNYQEQKLIIQIEQNTMLAQQYKHMYESCVQDISTLSIRINESNEHTNKLNLEKNYLLQENRKLSLLNSKVSEASQQLKDLQPTYTYLNECLEENEKKISELLQDKKEFNEHIVKLQKELTLCKQEWNEEITKLRSENSILKTICNTTETDKLRDELGKSRRRVREIKYLLEINEKELKDERVQRVKIEKALKKARKVLSNREKVNMAASEIQSLRKELSKSKKQITELLSKLKICKDDFTSKETEYQTIINNTKLAYIKEKDSNDSNILTVKNLLLKVSEINSYYEKKCSDYTNLEEYLNLKALLQEKFFGFTDSASIETRELSAICSILQNKIQNITTLQDTEAIKLIQKVESLQDTCKEQKSIIECLTNKSDELRNMVSNTLPPIAIGKIVALIHRSSKLNAFY